MADPFEIERDLSTFDNLQDEDPDISETEAGMKGAMAAALTTPEVGERVQQDLLTHGVSQIEQDILAEAEGNRLQQDQNDVFEVLAADMPQNQKRDIVNQIIFERDERESLPLTTLFKEFTILNAETETENENLVQLGISEHFADVLEVDKELRSINKLLDFKDDALSIGTDFGMAILLPGWQFAVAEVLNTAIPGFVPSSGKLLIGDDIKRFKDHIRGLPPHERLATVRKVVQAINTNEFWLRDNGFMKFDLMNTLLGDLRDDTWDVVLNDIFSALDLLAIGELFRLGRAISRIGKTEANIQIRKFKDEKGRTRAFGTLRDEKGRFVKTARGTPGQVRRLLNSVARQENIKEGKRRQSLSGILDSTAASESRVVSKMAIEDETGAVAAVTGATREQHTMDGVIPKWWDDEVRVGPDLNDDLDGILDYDPTRILDTPEELKTAETAMDLRLQSVRTLAPRVHINKLGVRDIDGGFEGFYRVGDTEDRGFSSLKSAEGVATSFKNVNEIDIKILGRVYDEGEYIPVKDLPKGPGINNEYLVEFKVKHLVNPRDALEETAVMLDNGLTGKVASYFDKSASFLRWIVRAGNVMADVESARIDALTRIMRPMNRLSNKDQSKVFAVLDEGDRFFDEALDLHGKWFDTDELLVRFGSESNAQELIEGYQSVVRHQKKLHKLVNSATRRFLLAEDMKTVFVRKGRKIGEQKVLGRVVKREEIPTIKRIWDSDVGGIIETDASQLDILAKGDHEFIRFRTALFHKKEQVNFAIKRKGSNNIQVRSLPQEVVRQIPGYLSRIYDAPYILKRVVKSRTDGLVPEDKLIAVKVYTNKGDAIIERDRMRVESSRKGKDETYEVVEATELRRDKDYANQISLEYLENSGQLFTSQRGIELKGLGDIRELKSVQESIEAARARASRMGTRDLLVTKLMRNWEIKYGARFSADGKFPMDNNGVVRTRQVVEEGGDEFNDAVAFQRHIKMIAGIDDTTLTRFFRDSMIWIADRLMTPLANSPKHRLAAAILRNRNRNPLNAAKGLAFTKFIIFNPIRQLFLQSQQMTIYLGLDHGAKYFLSGRGIIDHGGLLTGMYFRTTPMWDQVANTTRKGMKNVDGTQMSKQDYEDFIDAYRKSGIPASIDSHQYVALSNVDRRIISPTGKILEGVEDTTDFFLKAIPRSGHRFIMNPFNQVRRVFRRVGFDFGEQTQLAASFLAVRNKWIKNNPLKAHLWSQADNLAEIAGDARSVSFNMNQTGVLQFQKGVLGVMFQFLSHATKSLQVLIPEKAFGKTIGKLSNKVYNDKERAKIAVQQLAIYGTGAFGLNRLLEDAMAELEVEAPADVMTAVEEGIFGTTLNMTLRALAGESVFDLDRTEPVTDVEFSQNFATFSGSILMNPMNRIADSMILSDQSVLEFFLGPTFQVAGDIAEALKFTAAVRGHGVAAATTSEEGVLLMDEWARQFLPVYNNFIRGRAEQAMNRHISNSGLLGVEVTDAEATFRRYFGQSSRRQNQLQRELIEISGLYGHPREDSLRTALDDTAAEYFKMAERLSEQRNEGKRTVPEITKIILKNAQGLKEVLDPSEYDYIFNIAMPNLVFKKTSADGLESRFINSITNGLNNRIPKLEDDSFISGIKNHAPFKGQEALIELLESIRSDP